MSVSITQNLFSAWCLGAEHCSVVAGWAWGITGQQFHLLWPFLLVSLRGTLQCGGRLHLGYHGTTQHLSSETQSDTLNLLPRLSKSHDSIFVLLHTTNYSHDLQVSCLLRYTLSQILAMSGHWHSREAAGTLHNCLYFLPSLPVSFLQTRRHSFTITRTEIIAPFHWVLLGRILGLGKKSLELLTQYTPKPTGSLSWCFYRVLC